MNYISGFIKLMIGIGATIVGVFALHQYFGGHEQDLARLQKLKTEGRIVIPLIDTMVLEITIKGHKSYSLNYKYEVDGKKYKGNYAFKSYSQLDSLSGEATYLPSDPQISSLDINGEFASAQKDVEENKSSSFEMWIGIVLMLFGMFQIFRGLIRVGLIPPRRATPPPLPRQSDFV